MLDSVGRAGLGRKRAHRHRVLNHSGWKNARLILFSTWVHCKRISKTPHILKLASRILYGCLVVARMQIPRQDVLQNKMVSHQFF